MNRAGALIIAGLILFMGVAGGIEQAENLGIVELAVFLLWSLAAAGSMLLGISDLRQQD